MKTESEKFNKVYEIDASQIKGKTQRVVFPENIEDVRKIVVNSKRIVSRGGGTGLSGGSVPQNGEDIVVDLSKLTKIENLDGERMTVEVEAGVILDDLQNYLDKYNLEFPINPSSHSVCTIGGMIATDAVGNRALKYKRTSYWIKWIDIMDGHGNLSRKGITEISDYVGMEGITGIIVRASLKLTKKIIRTATLLKFDDLNELIDKVKFFKRESVVSMVEFIDNRISKWIGLDEDYHLIIEFENDSGELKGEDYKNLLVVRDKIYPFLASKNYSRIEDPKISIEKFRDLILWLDKKEVPVFGHLSVGIIHPCFNKEQEKYIPRMINFIKKNRGKISGEHGIGILKKEFVEVNDKKILINIKKRTDPLNKFNIGKVI